MTNLSQRLLAVAGCVTPGCALLDVGCDHAFLTTYLLENGTVPCALCSDINSGPLARAKEHIQSAHLENAASTELTGGIPRDYRKMLPALPHTGVSVVIAGMGGALMGRILADARDMLPDFTELVLSPQSELATFRRTLTELGLLIEEEKFLLDESKYYTVIRVVPTAGPIPEMTEEELHFGPCLIRERNPVPLAYLRRRKVILLAIEKEIRDHAGESAEERLCELSEERKLVDAAITEMTGGNQRGDKVNETHGS